MDKIFEITAKEVTVQVKDERTGVVYNRTLPIDYYENANVLKLSGENLDGSSSSIVFYSARGIERLKDLTGRGDFRCSQKSVFGSNFRNQQREKILCTGFV